MPEFITVSYVAIDNRLKRCPKKVKLLGFTCDLPEEDGFLCLTFLFKSSNVSISQLQ